MRFSLAAALLTSVVSVLAADHLVLVGDNNTLTFNPSSVQAAQGDSVTFEFRSKNHSVTQSTFANPCSLMTTPKTGVDSGFQATSNTTTAFAQWKITIDNATAPLWFFCAQTNPKNHCQSGMVFAVNPTADKSFDAYLQNAMNSANSTATGSSSAAGGASTTVAGAPGTVAGASSVPVAGASTTAASSAVSMVTSIGTIPTNSVPPPNTGISGAAATALGAGAANATATNPPSSAMRIGGSASGLLVAGLVASLIL